MAAVVADDAPVLTLSGARGHQGHGRWIKSARVRPAACSETGVTGLVSRTTAAAPPGGDGFRGRPRDHMRGALAAVMLERVRLHVTPEIFS